MMVMTEGDSSSEDDGKLLLMETMKRLVDIDLLWPGDSKIEDVAEIGPDDLAPGFVDLRAQVELIKKQRKTEKDDCSAKFKEYVEINQKAAGSLHIHVSEEDILEGLSDPTILQIDISSAPPPCPPTKKTLSGGLIRKRSERDSDEISIIAVKRDRRTVAEPVPSFLPPPPRPASSKIPVNPIPGPDEQLVFVFNKLTSEKKFLTLRKGHSPPPPYEVISFDKDVVPLLSNQFPNHKLTSSASCPPPQPPQKKVNGKLNSLSDLMTSSKSAPPGNLAKPNIVTVPPQNDPLAVIPPLITVSAKKNPPKPVSIPPKPVSIPPSSSLVGLFCCKLCGAAFPCHADVAFRRHMFIQHAVELTETSFPDSRKSVEVVYRCKKCKENFLFPSEKHLQSCSPPPDSSTKDTAFEKVPTGTPYWTRCANICGVSGCVSSFQSRNELRTHIFRNHSSVSSLMILDPIFRCSKCLKRFDESISLGRHVTICEESGPREETILELAKTLLHCDFCGKKHSGLSDTTSCYLKRSVFRCVLCFVCSRDKPIFFRHLHTHHNLKLYAQPKLLLECPMCDHRADKYTVIFPHIVTEHYAPALAKQTASPPPRRKSGETPSPSSTSSGSNSMAVTPYTGPPTPPKVFELRTRLPPGVVINTNKISSVVPIVVRAPSPVATPNNMLVPVTSKSESSPAYRQPMSGIFKQTPKVPSTVGLSFYRPSTSISSTPTILRTARPSAPSEIPSLIQIAHQNGSPTGQPATDSTLQLISKMYTSGSSTSGAAPIALKVPFTKLPSTSDRQTSRVINIGGKSFAYTQLSQLGHKIAQSSSAAPQQRPSAVPPGGALPVIPSIANINKAQKPVTGSKSASVSVAHKQSSSGLSFSSNQLPSNSTFRVPSLPVDQPPKPAVTPVSNAQPESNQINGGEASKPSS